MNITKKILAVVLSVVMLLCSFPMSTVATAEDIDTSQNSEASENTIEIGDYITLGIYLNEPIVWRCVDIDENGPLMLSDKILCFKAFDAFGKDEFYHTDGWGYIRKTRGSNCWSDSNLRQWLNSSSITIEWSHCPPTKERVYQGYNAYADEPGFLTSFDASELSMIKTVTQKSYINSWETKREGYCDGGSNELNYSVSNIPTNYDKYYYQNVTDKIFLLNPEQADAIYQNFGNYLYDAYPTQAAISNNEFEHEGLSVDKTWKYWSGIPRNEGASYENQTLFGNADVAYSGACSGYYGVRPAFYLNVDNYDDAYETKNIVIHEQKFNTNIDYYTAHCDSSVYNPKLAYMLAALSAASYSEAEIKAAYESLGFEFDDAQNYGSYNYETQDPWLCGYSISFKNSQYNDDVVCLVSVRGSKLLSDWLGNVDIFTVFDEKHEGFFLPALSILNHINSIVELKFASKNVKYVITGHSRGAAVGNLLAVALMETKATTANNVFSYNFACPDVACQTSLVQYTNIFNLCNTEDVVPFVPSALCDPFVTEGSSWGKYGQTLWFTVLPTFSPPPTFPAEQVITMVNILNMHDIELYLSFLGKQLYQEDWPTLSWRDFSGKVIKVFCPVDVIITDEKGNQVASVINGEITYYDSSFEGLILAFTDGDKKVIYISGATNFNVDLIGTDDGTMTFTVENYNLTTGEASESKTFNDVALEEGKTMYCAVNETTEIDEVPLFVVEEKDGETVYTHTIETDGTEEILARGDMNGDGKVNIDDAIYLLRHVMMPDKYAITQLGDVNGDDKANIDDAIYLLRYVMMPDKYPLEA